MDKIKEAAIKYLDIPEEHLDSEDSSTLDKMVGFSLSNEIKEYWQKDMYSEEEVLQLLLNAKLSTYESLYDWFQQNKKK